MQPAAFGGFGTHVPGTTIQSVVSRLHLQKETCTNGYGKTTSTIPLIIFVFGEFSSPVICGNLPLLCPEAVWNCCNQQNMFALARSFSEKVLVQCYPSVDGSRDRWVLL